MKKGAFFLFIIIFEAKKYKILENLIVKYLCKNNSNDKLTNKNAPNFERGKCPFM